VAGEPAQHFLPVDIGGGGRRQNGISPVRWSVLFAESMGQISSHSLVTDRQPWLLGSRVRQTRLAAGLVMFTYVSLHLLNHALLNISVATADRALLIQKWIWQGFVGTALLYGALTVHPLLGLWALYARRNFRWSTAEALQLLLGLSVPALLANHVTVTRLAWTAYGLDKGYNAELDALYISGPAWGWVQIGVLVVAWTHACIGLYFLLRLRRWWPAWQAPLLAVAVLLPALALLGFYAGGREVARALAEPAWRAAHLPVTVTGSAAQKAYLASVRNWFLVAYAASIALVLLARGVRWGFDRRRAQVVIRYPGGVLVRVPTGMAVLDTSRLRGIAHASVCGGKGRCSTCRVRVLWSACDLPPPAAHERRVLDGIGADPATVRLACQLRPLGDCSVVPLIPPEVASEFVLGRTHRIPGDERFLVAMFIDLRGSTALAEKQMPFDSVFLVGRFIAAATRAVVASGGRPVQFLGDGLLALFGLEAPPDRACRQALAAVGAAQAEFAALSPLFDQQTGQMLRYGIGVHCGRAIVGEIGFSRHVAFTALGETVNLAHGLQELSRAWAVAAVISQEVFAVAGADPGGLEAAEATPRGRAVPIAVRVVRNDMADAGAPAGLVCPQVSDATFSPKVI
jgi:adenylate cyclase